VTFTEASKIDHRTELRVCTECTIMFGINADCCVNYDGIKDMVTRRFVSSVSRNIGGKGRTT